MKLDSRHFCWQIQNSEHTAVINDEMSLSVQLIEIGIGMHISE
jgi:hypothetical protein